MARGDLDQNQLDKLLQFQDLTGIDDIDQCRDILEAHHWDIETSIQDTLNMQDIVPANRQAAGQRNDAYVAQNDVNVMYERFGVLGNRGEGGILGWLSFLIFLPFQFAYAAVFSIFDVIVKFLRPDNRRYLTDPVGDVTAFIQSYEQHYGLQHPVFQQGSYGNIINQAKRELKFLLVYLHSDHHQNTPKFCQATLGNEEVIRFINDNMLFWACSVNTAEGYRASQALHENTYPFLAMIVLKETKMMVVARLEGFVGAQDLMQRLRRVLADNEGYLAAARADAQERNLTQTIRKQQDEAYLESLLADQEKERKKREEQMLLDQEEEQRRNVVAEEHRRKDEIQRMKVELADQVPVEPANGAPNTITVVIRFKQGTRIARKFLRNQSLKYLYYFVFCHEHAPDNFQIVTNFPRKVLPCQPTPDIPEPLTFAEFGLGSSEMFFVHDLEA